ncbi:transcriptional regulator with XRE-family HTH domain [Kibdelosporangium banguiense]|uniref:Transcriptional regulator with XRE-family HTH domain n=1 Tax=Kibdelosporangium banguiense TaxID=1365924 RepID=A0ABS4T8X2_9PSEU|nr:helix-turn-helix transcriptional regulator [Kibdelosporangium banguiense]MBP2320883.1 transcriptional regulator with XRE-family HTH domain [Kibdelosporangium banguiense]
MPRDSAAQPPMLSPTVGRRWLAQEIRRLREAAGLTQSDLAKRLRCNATKIVHIETMRNPMNGPDLEVLLPFLGVPDERVDWYLQVCDLSKQKGWWDGNQAIPGWFSLYVGLEWGAREVLSWDMGYVPGLLQSKTYIEEMLRYTGSDEAVLSKVDARLRRQEALHRKTDPLRVHAIIDEAVLRRVIGDVQTMRVQLRHLAALTELPNVTVQVMPFANSGHRGSLGSFRWLGFPQKGDPGAVYLENQNGGLFLEKPEELSLFLKDFADLAAQAITPEDSFTFIAKRAKDFR